MKRMIKPAVIAAYILIIITGAIWQAGGASAEETIKLKVHDQVTDTATMDNMKPGDRMRSDYTIINEGNGGFDYEVDFKFVSGDTDLYDILTLTLQKEGATLYSGKMSEAAGRITVGYLASGGQHNLRMDVTFPAEAGNEYQGKASTVAFEFSAGASTGPSPQPSAEPTATATATAAPSPLPSSQPSSGPTASPAASASPDASPPGPTPAATATPGPGGTATAAPPSSPGPTGSPTPDDTVVDEQIPLGGLGSPAPDASATATPPAATGEPDGSNDPEEDTDLIVPNEELPLAGPEAGDRLPGTAEPWYNLILISLAAGILCLLLIRKLKSKK
ncbi:hypothetical protein [Paenibacillus donghaensis]|uniref:Gram-positive cocci surface proteins LPxTG domain-containing protein n=1 Tax=Paenibacillus donghaensis TaxID=414771 RepID=A0A2Z2KEY3_9BACL|nr:hypothetical protein [Paenibacillus donghaensis]ASA24664.1 hypothetical protein B9T62_30270 [Paenibacillus donghaensis]